MTKLEQAARQALETLERASDAGYSVECDETITALREALEQVAPRKTERWNPMYSSNAQTALQMAAVIAHRDTEATPPAEQQAQPGAVYAELHEPDATTVGLGAVWNRHSMRDFADRTHALRMQAAPKAAPGDAIDEAMRERDDAEDFIDALLDEVLGHERPEWSNLYGRADALNDVQERMTSLHKPAVDKAWGQFQSAMAAPQQEAQEPALFVSAKQLADLADPSHATGGSYLPARKTRAGLFTQPLYAAPQPAPALLSESEYKRGYRDGYEHRDAEVRGALV